MKPKASRQQTTFDEILAQYRGRLGRVALTYAGQESDDLLQEILLQIWRSIPSFEERSSIGTWCYRIAINTAITWKRKAERKRSEQTSDDLDQSLAKADDSARQQTGLLQSFLSSLKDIDQAVLLMHLDNVPHPEIAASLGVTPGAIRTRMSRLKQKLAEWESPIETNAVPQSPAREVTNG